MAQDKETGQVFFERFADLGKRDAELAARRVLSEENPAVREACVRLIAKHFGRQYMRLYRELAFDPHPYVSFAAASAIFYNTVEAEDVEVMRRLVEEAAFEPTRYLAMSWLVCPRRDTDSWDDVLRGMRSPDVAVRSIAVRKLVGECWPSGSGQAAELVEFLRSRKQDITEEEVHPDVYSALVFLEQLRHQCERRPWLDDRETQRGRIEEVLNWWDSWEDNPWNREAQKLDEAPGAGFPLEHAKDSPDGSESR